MEWKFLHWLHSRVITLMFPMILGTSVYGEESSLNIRVDANQNIRIEWQVVDLAPAIETILSPRYELQLSTNLHEWIPVSESYQDSSVDIEPGSVTMAVHGHSIQTGFFRLKVFNDFSYHNLAQANLKDTQFPNSSFFGADLFAADLSRSDFSFSDLSGSDLRHAILASTKLNGARLFGSRMFKANFSHADLRNADLSYSELTEADFFGATLSGVDFSEAILQNAQFDFADLRGADFSRALKVPEKWILIHNLVNGDGDILDLVGKDLSFSDLRKTDLSGTLMQNSNLIASDLRGAILKGTNLTGADVRFVDFRNVEIDEASRLPQKTK
ncbi:MAG TPA: pentapeptide repeat-containing protein, partial [Verrucomicrobia bacterium]|nr:pentapeptide repeat-containing protein [Verrucomicrobiota bacterium]